MLLKQQRKEKEIIDNILPSQSTYKAILKSLKKHNNKNGKINPKLSIVDKYRKEHFRVRKGKLQCKCRVCGKWKQFDTKHFPSYIPGNRRRRYLRLTCYICWNQKRKERTNNRFKTDPTLRYYHYQYNSKKNYIVFNLSYNEFESLVYQPCYYCGYNPDDMIGIDRVDSTKCYTIDNVVPCCKVCNMMKSAIERKKKMKLNKIDFIEQCAKITNYQLKKS